MRLLPLTDRDQAEALGSSRPPTATAATLVLLVALLAAPPALSSGARVERLFYQSGVSSAPAAPPYSEHGPPPAVSQPPGSAIAQPTPSAIFLEAARRRYFASMVGA